MSNELKIGIIGLDTSHAPALTELLNDSSKEFRVPGGRVVYGFPGGSPDFALSYERIEGFTSKIRDEFGVEMLDSAAAVAERSDAILVTSVDGRAHLPIFREIAPLGKPVFIDKPFTVSHPEALTIVELARQHNVPLMTASLLRYGQTFTDALAAEELIGIDCCGPMEIQPTQPGLFWYGIHTVEMLYAALGRGCERVTAVTTEDGEFATGVWSDGRIGTVRGYRAGKRNFGALLHGPKTSRYVEPMSNPKPAYASLLENIIEMFQTGKSPIDVNDSLEIIRFIEAANESRETGQSVQL
jgi:predicted dehydrogenase